jgi:hypothetical protein
MNSIQITFLGSGDAFIVTHMSPDMLSRLDALPFEYAEDGKTIEI